MIPETLEYQHDGKLVGAEKERLLAVTTPEKHRKGNFRISNHALFSVMKKRVYYRVCAILGILTLFCHHNLCIARP